MIGGALGGAPASAQGQSRTVYTRIFSLTLRRNLRYDQFPGTARSTSVSP